MLLPLDFNEKTVAPKISVPQQLNKVQSNQSGTIKGNVIQNERENILPLSTTNGPTIQSVRANPIRLGSGGNAITSHARDRSN